MSISIKVTKNKTKQKIDIVRNKMKQPLTIFYGALMAIGIPGNLLTCFIIATNSYMRTPPNFFLFNLAAADLLTLTRKNVNLYG